MNIGGMIRGLVGDGQIQEPKKLELKVGQVVKGVVQQQLPDQEALVNIGGVQVRARLETPLKQGEVTMLQVQPESATGQIVLKPLHASQVQIADSSLGEVLKTLGMNDTADNRQLVQLLHQSGVALTKESVKAFIDLQAAMGKSMPQTEWLPTAVIAAQKGLPMTPETILSLHKAVQGPPFHEALDQLSDMLDRTQQSGKELTPQTRALLETVRTLLQQVREAGGQLTQTGTPTAQPQAGAPAGVAAPLAQPQAGAPAGAATPSAQPHAGAPAGAASPPAQPQASAPAGAASPPAQPQASAPAGAAAPLAQPPAGAPAGAASPPAQPQASAPAGAASPPAQPQAGAPAGGATPPAQPQAGAPAGAAAPLAQPQAGAPAGAAAPLAQPQAGAPAGAVAPPAQPQAGAPAGAAAPSAQPQAGASAGAAAPPAQSQAGASAGAAAPLAQPQASAPAGAAVPPAQPQAGAPAGAATPLAQPPASASASASAAPAGTAHQADQQEHLLGRLMKTIGIEHEHQAARWLGAEDGKLAAAADKSTDSLKSALMQLAQSADAPDEIKQAAQQAVHQITGQQLLMSPDRSSMFSHITMFVPIVQPDGTQTAAIHIQSRKGKNGSLDASNCRLVFDLQMKALGNTMVDVQVVNRIVSLHVHNDFPQTGALLEAYRDEISGGLASIGYQFISMKVSPYPEKASDLGDLTGGGGRGKDLAAGSVPGVYTQKPYKGVDIRL
ncbi:hypothetical protein [Paenibacillus puerhi]|uniref:hypothetical protein n=1 Tax=Paenibacillus puerhi TaxID=2692622 RepID=UPI00135683CC|nr:hypothetical protein [Paenibacillus puerhi]